MFKGTHAITVDSKGRIAVPARYRGLLQERCAGSVVMTVSPARENCLVMYPSDQWEIVESHLINLSTLEPLSADMKRFVLGYAMDVDMDKGGRLLIPASLRDVTKINLGESVYLAGQGHQFEIWTEGEWQRKLNRFVGSSGDDKALPVDFSQLPF